MKQLTAASLFAGIGGICLGFKKAEFKVMWANEYNSKACETYRTNLPETLLYEQDIHSLDCKDVSYVDVITSGFPCQAFSIAGYREGFRDRKGRGNLFFQTARFIQELQPKAYLLENVKNLLTHDGGKTIEVIKKTMTDGLGYSFIPFVLNSKDFGNIPQTRDRIYIVGFKDEAGIEYSSVESNGSASRYLTHKFKIPKPTLLTKTIHDCLNHEKQDRRYYYGPDHMYFKTLKREIKNKDTIYQWRRIYVRENKSNLCPTLTANMGAGGHNVPLIVDDYGIRKLTPGECLRFQGFPPEFEFPNGMAQSHCYMQAGNSVVVPVIKRIAQSIRIALGVK